ncbi:GH3 auxin-responsive promoter [Scleroderma citrinum]
MYLLVIVPPSHPPQPVETLSPDLIAILKRRTEGTLHSLIKKNKDTRYFSESPVFTGFHTSLQNLSKEGNDKHRDDALIESFYTGVPFTSYESYEPFIKKFLESNCQEKDVENMFAPGLPHAIAVTSSTSSGKPKYFAQYSYGPVSYTPKCGGKICQIFSLLYRQVTNVQGDKGDTIKKIPVALGTANIFRIWTGLEVDNDQLNIKLAGSHTSPIAVGFISEFRSFILMHALFALAECEIDIIIASFSTTLLDMFLYMEEEWDILVTSIDSGELPDWTGIDHVREYLQPHFPSRPERAAELRAIGKASQHPGWLAKVWPMLRGVSTIASGVFATAIPKIKHYFGPDVKLFSHGYFCSEAPVGLVYDPSDMNLFKLASTEFFEFIDVDNEGTASDLIRPWQVNIGKLYEIVVTAHKGLWRYRIGDVIEIAGFDPDDGTPLVRFVERRNLVAWLAGAILTERHVTNAILAVQDTLGSIGEFTAVIDDYSKCIGYLVEIQGDLGMVFTATILDKGPKADEAPAQLLVEFFRLNEEFRSAFDSKKMKPPTIRTLKTGTFREYRRWKIEMTKTGSGQVKVPVVMRDSIAREWILQWVERELGYGSISSESHQ